MPNTPNAGANPAAFVQKPDAIAYCDIWASTSSSRMSFVSAGSVPSTTSCTPRARNSSSISGIILSRASTPSFRALSANSTIDAIVPDRSAFGDLIIVAMPAFRPPIESLIAIDANVAAIVPIITSPADIGSPKKMPIGSMPPANMTPNATTIATRIPTTVVGIRLPLPLNSQRVLLR